MDLPLDASPWCTVTREEGGGLTFRARAWTRWLRVALVALGPLYAAAAATPWLAHGSYAMAGPIAVMALAWLAARCGHALGARSARWAAWDLLEVRPPGVGGYRDQARSSGVRIDGRDVAPADRVEVVTWRVPSRSRKTFTRWVHFPGVSGVGLRLGGGAVVVWEGRDEQRADALADALGRALGCAPLPPRVVPNDDPPSGLPVASLVATVVMAIFGGAAFAVTIAPGPASRTLVMTARFAVLVGVPNAAVFGLAFWLSRRGYAAWRRNRLGA